jgi:23S rRNA G2445 N2-methylase RlmL
MSQYRHETIRDNYSLYACGSVLVSQPGHPGFPVRLASEVFQTCLHLRGDEKRVVLYDPFCGAGYLLATTAFRHWERIRFVLGSDFSEAALSLAGKNLSLLSAAGLHARRDELAAAQTQEWRPSRQEALDCAEELLRRQADFSARHQLEYRLSRADAGVPQEVAVATGELRVDVVMADVPYGEISDWQGSLQTLDSPDGAVFQLLDALLRILAPEAVVAIVSPKKVAAAHPGYERLRRFKIGKRMVTYLSPLSPSDR